MPICSSPKCKRSFPSPFAVSRCYPLQEDIKLHDKNIYAIVYSEPLECLITGGEDATIQLYYLNQVRAKGGLLGGRRASRLKKNSCRQEEHLARVVRRRRVWAQEGE